MKPATSTHAVAEGNDICSKCLKEVVGSWSAHQEQHRDWPSLFPANHDAPCRDSANCDRAVVGGGEYGWYITFGHAGFNSPINNREGYRSKALALSAILRYEAKGRQAANKARPRIKVKGHNGQEYVILNPLCSTCGNEIVRPSDAAGSFARMWHRACGQPK